MDDIGLHIDRQIRVHSKADLDSFVTNKWGILEPPNPNQRSEGMQSFPTSTGASPINYQDSFG